MTSKRRVAAAKLLPRFDAPLDDRRAIAVAWYQDRVRVSDISAACGMASRRIMLAVDASDSSRRGWVDCHTLTLPLWPMLASALEGGSVESLMADYGIHHASALYVMQLASGGKPRQAKRGD